MQTPRQFRVVCDTCDFYVSRIDGEEAARLGTSHIAGTGHAMIVQDIRSFLGRAIAPNGMHIHAGACGDCDWIVTSGRNIVEESIAHSDTMRHCVAVYAPLSRYTLAPKGKRSHAAERSERIQH